MISKEHIILRGMMETKFSPGLFPICSSTGLGSLDAKDEFPFIL